MSVLRTPGSRGHAPLARAALVVAVTGGLVLGGAGVASAFGTHGGRHRPPAIEGVVTSTSAGSFTLKVRRHHTLTVDVTPSTTFSEPGAPSAPTAVTDGERVSVIPLWPQPPATTTTTSGTWTVTAAAVVIHLQHEAGTVQSVSGTGFVVAGPWGATHDVLTFPSTTYLMGGTPESGVSQGQKVVVLGVPDPTTPSDLDAVVVYIEPPQATTWTTDSTVPWSSFHPVTTASTGTIPTVVTGVVQSVSGDEITLTVSWTPHPGVRLGYASGDTGWGATDASVTTTTVMVSDTTVYSDPAGTATLDEVTTGEKITAKGTETDGVVTASEVFIDNGSCPGWTGSAGDPQAQAPASRRVTEPGPAAPPQSTGTFHPGSGDGPGGFPSHGQGGFGAAGPGQGGPRH